MTLATDILALVRERDKLAALVADSERREHEVARMMYRRGYRAGRAAKRRGAPVNPAPERNARGIGRRLATNG